VRAQLLRSELLLSPKSEEFVHEEGLLLEGGDSPILAHQTHWPHAPREPDIKVFLLSASPVAKAEPPERKYTPNLLIVLRNLTNEMGEVVHCLLSEDLLEGPRYDFHP
jgi:hypothetical protein